MKKLSILLTVLCIMFSSCASVKRVSDAAADEGAEMVSKTVKINVTVKIILLTKVGEEIKTEEVTEGWTGSGVVVAVDKSTGKGQSLIMSAAHVVNVPEQGDIALMQDSAGNPVLVVAEAVSLSVETANGVKCKAKKIYADADSDVGSVLASCIAGNVAEIAEELPPQNAIVSVSGAGLGVHPNGVFIIEDGRFAGLDDGFNPMELITVAVAPGHSGSGLFYRGKVVGIISAHSREYEHLTLAVSLENVKKAIKASMVKMHGG